LDPEGALLDAAKAADGEEIRDLVEGGTDPNVTLENGSTAVHMATATGQTALLRLVLEHGGDPNLKDESGLTALMMAAMWSRADTVTALAAAGAELDERNDDDRTALMIAVTEKRPELVRALLDAGANPRLSRRGVTTLAMAQREGTGDIELMLEQAMGMNRSRRRRF